MSLTKREYAGGLLALVGAGIILALLGIFIVWAMKEAPAVAWLIIGVLLIFAGGVVVNLDE